MLIVRGTKKLRDRMKGAPTADSDDESTTVLGDWFVNALFWKPQVALLVNSRTFLPVYMPLAPAKSLLDRIPDAIESTLRAHGVPEEIIAAERSAMSEVRVAPTNDRHGVPAEGDVARHQAAYLASRALRRIGDPRRST